MWSLRGTKWYCCISFRTSNTQLRYAPVNIMITVTVLLEPLWCPIEHSVTFFFYWSLSSFETVLSYPRMTLNSLCNWSSSCTLVLLSLPVNLEDYRYVPPCPACDFLENKCGTLFLQSMHSINWPVSPVQLCTYNRL